MLKRQRSNPSFVPDAYPTSEPTIDLYERVVKRRRQFPPPQLHSHPKGKAPWILGDSDGEEDVEGEKDAAGHLAPSELAQRLEHAGEYKNVNSLLRDLHAEQRHRILFSSPSLPHYLPPIHQAELNHSPDHSPHKLTPTPPACSPRSLMPSESHRRMPPFTISISSKDSSPVDHVEEQHVTQRYENTNKLIGSLFLSRRRQPDSQETQA